MSKKDYGYVANKYIKSDDENYTLKVFEKTWGHRVLIGISVCMLALAFLIALFCVLCLLGVFGLNRNETLPYIVHRAANVLYTMGIVGAILMTIPALFGIYVTKYPAKNMISIVLGILGILGVFLFIFWACVLHNSSWFSISMYSLVMLIFPVIYLIAALKVRRAVKEHQSDPDLY